MDLNDWLVLMPMSTGLEWYKWSRRQHYDGILSGGVLWLLQPTANFVIGLPGLFCESGCQGCRAPCIHVIICPQRACLKLDTHMPMQVCKVLTWGSIGWILKITKNLKAVELYNAVNIKFAPDHIDSLSLSFRDCQLAVFQLAGLDSAGETSVQGMTYLSGYILQPSSLFHGLFTIAKWALCFLLPCGIDGPRTSQPPVDHLTHFRLFTALRSTFDGLY